MLELLDALAKLLGLQHTLLPSFTRQSLLVRRHKTEREVGESVEHAWSGGEAAWGLHASIEGEAPSDLELNIDSHQYPY